jgi:hypothetical protein
MAAEIALEYCRCSNNGSGAYKLVLKTNGASTGIPTADRPPVGTLADIAPVESWPLEQVRQWMARAAEAIVSNRSDPLAFAKAGTNSEECSDDLKKWTDFLAFDLLYHLAKLPSIDPVGKNDHGLALLRFFALKERAAALAADLDDQGDDHRLLCARFVPEAAGEWLRALTHVDSQHLLLIDRFEVDRDEEMRKALFDERDNGFLRRWLHVVEGDDCNPAGVDPSDRRRWCAWLAEHWLLPRFDLAGTHRLFRALARTQKREGEPRSIAAHARRALGALAGATVDARLSRLARLPAVWTAARSRSDCWVPWLPWALSVVCIVSSWYVGAWASVFLPLGIAIPIVHATWLMFLTIREAIPYAFELLPRIWGGTLVGVLASLALPDDLTKALFEPRGAPGLVAYLGAGASLAVTFGYLAAELLPRLGPEGAPRHRWRLLGRTSIVTVVAFAQALLGAAMLTLLVRVPVSTSNAAEITWRTVVQQTSLHPTYVLAVASLSLVAGVLLQILWEERPATAPPF